MKHNGHDHTMAVPAHSDFDYTKMEREDKGDEIDRRNRLNHLEEMTDADSDDDLNYRLVEDDHQQARKRR